MPTPTLRLLLVLACLALLPGCRGGKTPPPPDAASSAAKVIDATAEAGPAPARPPESPTQPADPSLGQRRCLRVLPLATAAEAEAIWQRIKAGENFLLLAREMTKGAKHGPPVRCLHESEMEADVLKAVQPLRLGQVSPPFQAAAGWALALMTTDEYWTQGSRLFEAGRYEEAEAQLLKDVEINPDGPSWHLIALSRSARKDNAGAIKALDQALSWSPLSATLMNDKASLLMDQGQSEEAIRLYEEALHYAPDNPLIMNNLAWCLARNDQDLNRAERLARQAVVRAPNRAEFWDTLGMVQQMAGKPAQAAASYGQALKLDPEMAQAKANLVPSLLALDSDSLRKLLQTGPAATRKRLAGPSR